MIGTTAYTNVWAELASLSRCRELPPDAPRPNRDTWLAWRAAQPSLPTLRLSDKQIRARRSAAAHAARWRAEHTFPCRNAAKGCAGTYLAVRGKVKGSKCTRLCRRCAAMRREQWRAEAKRKAARGKG